MATSTIESRWSFMLRNNNPDLREIAMRASQEPVLRDLYPYSSLTKFCFSRTIQRPWDPMPAIITFKTEPRMYQLRTANGMPLVPRTSQPAKYQDAKAERK